MARDLGRTVPDESLPCQPEGGRSRVQARTPSETAWVSEKAVAEPFQKEVWTISEHLATSAKTASCGQMQFSGISG